MMIIPGIIINLIVLLIPTFIIIINSISVIVFVVIIGIKRKIVIWQYVMFSTMYDNEANVTRIM